MVLIPQPLEGSAAHFLPQLIPQPQNNPGGGFTNATYWLLYSHEAWPHVDDHMETRLTLAGSSCLGAFLGRPIYVNSSGDLYLKNILYYLLN